MIDRKIAIGIAAMMLALLFSLIGIQGNAAASGFRNFSLVQKVYHVSVEGTEIGIVKKKKTIEKLIAKKVEEAEKAYPEYDFAIAENITYKLDRDFRPELNLRETIETLKEKLTVKAKALKLSVGDEVVGYVKDEDEAREALRQFQSKFISGEMMDQYIENSEAKDTPLELDNGALILDISLSKEVSLSDGKVYPYQIMSVHEAVRKLSKNKVKEQTYTVKEGDALSGIANQFDLSVEELAALNPDLNEDELLHIGDEVTVTAPEPFVKVVVKKAKTFNKAIPYETKVKKDDSMYKGDSKVVQEGKPGEKKVRYLITVKNGEVTGKQVDKETVLEEPTEKVVVEGTKVIPSRGTGDFTWPTIGGYISSYMGMRWGDFHKGIDIARPSNRAILAADNGTVVSAGWNDDGYGNRVVINHNNGFKTTYNHMSKILVHVGETVRKGEQIGVMGTTGDSTGIHLHFEVYRNGHLVNPMGYLD
ncbi:MAG TPA: M23 family metallopeptidase [Bacillales bacterium]|nr:M23 family metallopeptidase [Bacillales bacterium]